MTALNTTGSSVSANSVEKAIWEIANTILISQRDSTKNPLNVNMVQISIDLSTGQASLAFSIPLTVSKTANSRAHSAKNEIIVTPWFVGGDITGGNASQDLFNLLSDLGELEKDATKNTANENRITYTITDDPLVMTGNVVFSANASLTGASVTVSVNNYLL